MVGHKACDFRAALAQRLHRNSEGLKLRNEPQYEGSLQDLAFSQARRTPGKAVHRSGRLFLSVRILLCCRPPCEEKGTKLVDARKALAVIGGSQFIEIALGMPVKDAAALRLTLRGYLEVA